MLTVFANVAAATCSPAVKMNAKRISVCAMLSALSVTALYVGSMLDFLDLTVACFASCLCAFAVIELGGGAPWFIYLVTSVLSAILVPHKITAAEYILFAGIYPILKFVMERRIKNDFLLWAAKLVYMAVVLVLFYFASKLFVTGEVYTPLVLGVTAALGIAAFVLFDIALTRLISYYFYKLRKRLRVEKYLK